MGWILLVAFVAMAVGLSARSQGSGSGPQGDRTLAWRVGVAVAIWAGVMALAMATFLVGALLIDDEQVGLSGPEGAAIDYVATRDSPFADRAWQVLHPNLRAQMSRQEYSECFLAGAQPAPAPDEDPEVGRHVRSDNVLVQGAVTYSVADRRDDTGVVSIDVLVERPSGADVVTVLLYPEPGQGWSVVGTAPADPCLVGSEVLGGGLQSTGQLSIELQEVPDLEGYRVLAGVWKGTPSRGKLVGGAFWTIYDDYAADMVHPLYVGAGDAPYTTTDEGEPEEGPGGVPIPTEGWGAGDYLWQEVALFDPGLYTIEVWANPDELLPFGSHIPAEPIERTCTVEVALTAGALAQLTITDVPAQGPCIYQSH